MLYNLRALAMAMVRPSYFLADAGQAAVKAWGGWADMVPGLRQAGAACELWCRLSKEYQKPAFCIEDVLVEGRLVPVEETVVEARPFCRLLHFAKQVEQRGPRLLIVAPMSGHYATLLRPTIEALLPEHDVYVTDWENAQSVPLAHGDFDLGSYVEYVRGFLTTLGPDTHVLAVCQPTVPVLAAVALMAQDKDPNRPRSMTLIAGPIDTRISPTAVNDFALEHNIEWFRSRMIDHVPAIYPGAGRQVYPGFLQLACFMSMNVSRHVEAHYEFFSNVVNGETAAVDKHRAFYDEYNAVLDMPAAFYLETIEKIFIEHHLPRGILEVGSRRVKPAAIRDVALFTIEGSADDITGLGQTKAAQSLCNKIPAAMKEHLVIDGVGHYGTFSGSKFRQQIVPAISRFIRAH